MSTFAMVPPTVQFTGDGSPNIVAHTVVTDRMAANTTYTGTSVSGQSLHLPTVPGVVATPGVTTTLLASQFVDGLVIMSGLVPGPANQQIRLPSLASVVSELQAHGSLATPNTATIFDFTVSYLTSLPPGPPGPPPPSLQVVLSSGSAIPTLASVGGTPTTGYYLSAVAPSDANISAGSVARFLAMGFNLATVAPIIVLARIF